VGDYRIIAHVFKRELLVLVVAIWALLELVLLLLAPRRWR